MSTFKILVVGDAGVGKTTFIHRHKTGEFEKKYNTTNLVDVRCLNFNTNKGEVNFTICDMGGQDKFDETKNAYGAGCDGAIIMFDVTSKVSYNNVLEHYNFVNKYCKDDSIVLCGNKVECKDRKVKPSDITFHRSHQLQYYDISAKSNYNFEKPFLFLIRKFLGEDTNFMESSALAPPEVITTLQELKALESEEINKNVLDTRLKLFSNNCCSDISLKMAMQIIKNNLLWEEWYNRYKKISEKEIILCYSDGETIKFCVFTK
jgi:GTP-binding nuclear protein Ran